MPEEKSFITVSKSGDIELSNGYVFKWMLEGEKIPEIYGLIEKNHTIVRGTAGWYRTADANEAARIANGRMLLLSWRIMLPT